MADLPNSLVGRLVAAKYLFRRGLEALESNSFYASGLAILSFHDTAEMTLRVIAEHHSINLKRQMGFPNLLDAVSKGVASCLEYRRFARLAPRVKFSIDNSAFGAEFNDDGTLKWWGGSRFITPSEEDAAFCVRFATDAILRREERPVPSEYPHEYSIMTNVRYRVLKPSPVLASYASGEELFVAGAGDELKGLREYQPQNRQYLALLVDDDVAFVKKDSVEEIQDEG